jgi:hypothetical protein
MPNPGWDKASVDKKLEMLRADVRRLFEVVNVLVTDTERILGLARQTEFKLNEVAEAVEELEEKSPKVDQKKKGSS